MPGFRHGKRVGQPLSGSQAVAPDQLEASLEGDEGKRVVIEEAGSVVDREQPR